MGVSQIREPVRRTAPIPDTDAGARGEGWPVPLPVHIP